MSDTYGTAQYEHAPDDVARAFAPEAVEVLNVLAALDGVAYAVSGDALANWDGRGAARAAERRLKRLAAPGVEFIVAAATEALSPKVRQILRNGGKP